MLNHRIFVDSVPFEKEPYIFETKIKGVLLIRRPQFIDHRGYFQEEFRINDISEFLGRHASIAQSQISYSKVGVLRGIHVEPWDKFITPMSGRMVGVVVDLRSNSPTFKKWIIFEFDQTDHKNAKTSLFVPEGCGNSLFAFKNKSDKGDGTVLYQYSSSKLYNPKNPGFGIHWKDPELSIPWPSMKPILTEKDKSLQFIKDIPSFNK